MIARCRNALLLGAALVATTSLAAAPASAATPECPHAREVPTPLTVPEARRALLCLINVIRAGAGAPIVHTVAPLRAAAKRYARRMVEERFFNHEKIPQGPSVDARARDTGYLDRVGAWELAETLAWAQEREATPRAMLYYWLGSRAHRSVILDPRFKHVGIGVAYGAPERIDSASTAATYAVTFGRRPPAPG